jgi:secondary thiamine-phosphate synthase enzyme
MYHQESIVIQTRGRGTYDVRDQVDDIVNSAGVSMGLCHIFIHHTSASLILCENADPTVRQDLERFMAAVVPDGAAMFKHVSEGPDDMPAHVRSVLTQSALTLPVSNRRCGLGTWQGIYVWEHRTAPHRRKLTVTVNGE